LQDESALVDAETYEEFNDKVLNNKTRLTQLIDESSLPVVGYGAAAKGVVMSNYVQRKLKYIVDENPMKIGKIIGGVNIPIVAPETLINEPGDLMIIVYAWNFFDEIHSKIKKLRPNNNDIIVSSMQ
jgi:hypothetical protein